MYHSFGLFGEQDLDSSGNKECNVLGDRYVLDWGMLWLMFVCVCDSSHSHPLSCKWRMFFGMILNICVGGKRERKIYRQSSVKTPS